jgi:hypothetical protein
MSLGVHAGALDRLFHDHAGQFAGSMSASEPPKVPMAERAAPNVVTKAHAHVQHDHVEHEGEHRQRLPQQPVADRRRKRDGEHHDHPGDAPARARAVVEAAPDARHETAQHAHRQPLRRERPQLFEKQRQDQRQERHADTALQTRIASTWKLDSSGIQDTTGV